MKLELGTKNEKAEFFTLRSKFYDLSSKFFMTLAPSRIDILGHELAIAWNDGKESFIPLEKLRRACPCATCGGEPDVLGRVERPRVSYGPKSFELRDVGLVGGYALQPTWNDGHNTGLYTFRQLRALDEHGAS